MQFFIDMDGTIASWNEEASLEDLYSDGYFFKLYPYPILEELKALRNRFGIEMYIISAYISEEALYDKQAWLDRYFPEIDRDHRIFVPYGENKGEFVQKKLKKKLNKSCVLVDDHSPNLLDWERCGGEGIKALNGINGKGQKWKGHTLSVV